MPIIVGVLAGPAVAADGILEINQTCAQNTGCFKGDTAGFPVSISAPGSYRLTSNLTVPAHTGISVNASRVSIDLGGFEIAGPVTCSGDPLVCDGDGSSGSGVAAAASTVGISVRNGSITGMSIGVALTNQAEVTNLRVRWNGMFGISSGAGSRISNNTAFQNGSSGISFSIGSTISNNTAFRNGGSGIVASGSSISGNAAYLNGYIGINGGAGSIISGNSAYQNGADGIQASSGATIIGNTAQDNGDTTDPALETESSAALAASCVGTQRGPTAATASTWAATPLTATTS